MPYANYSCPYISYSNTDIWLNYYAKKIQSFCRSKINLKKHRIPL